MFTIIRTKPAEGKNVRGSMKCVKCDAGIYYSFYDPEDIGETTQCWACTQVYYIAQSGFIPQEDLYENNSRSKSRNKQ